jgi:serine/threonine protein kinase
MKPRDSLIFCLADQVHFDVPERLDDGNSHFGLASGALPAGWTRQGEGIFVTILPPGGLNVEQGWKIHISSVAATAEEVLDIAAKWFLAHDIAFKFVRSAQLGRMINSKHWPRSSSGKFITAYPENEAIAVGALRHLGAALAGFAGPYVLTDVRCGKGPVFTRYGAFRRLELHLDDGSVVPAIRAPSGALVEDKRMPVFQLPDFVTMPDDIRDLVDPTTGGLDDFPYSIDSSILFSNAGGLYLGTCKATGERVVVREARPHAGLDANHDDAICRLRAERAILSALEGHPALPRLLFYATVWEHEFLVREMVDLPTLLTEITHRYPLVHPVPVREEIDAYLRWSSSIVDQVEAAIKDIHQRGFALGDLHPDNILVGDDGRVVFIDLECAAPVEGRHVHRMGAPGLHTAAASSPAQADLYALDRLRLMMLMPAMGVIGLDPRKEQTLRRMVQAEFGSSPYLADHRSIAPAPDTIDADEAARLFTGEAADWPALKAALVEGIISRASPDRADILYPGDPQQFTYGPATLAYGAAGTILALSAACVPIPQEQIDWLHRAAMSDRGAHGRGLFTGLHGTAFALDRAGETDLAATVLDRAMSRPAPAEMGFFEGAAGVALNLFHFADRLNDERLRTQALQSVRAMAARIAQNDAVIGPAGLFDGYSGIALALLAAFEASGEAALLDAAEDCLRRDLAAGAFHADGTFQLRAGTKNLLYFDGGSTGVGFVLLKFLQYRSDAEFEAIVDAILWGCNAPFVFQPGLFQGRLGLTAFAVSAQRARPCATACNIPDQVRRLGWHAISANGSLGLPGSRLIRASTDLATGASGALLVLTSAFEDCDSAFPFL